MFHQLKDSLLNSKVVLEDRAELHSLCRVLEMPLGPQQKTPTRLLKNTHKSACGPKGFAVRLSRASAPDVHSLFVAIADLLQQGLPPGSTQLQPGGQRPVLLLTQTLDQRAQKGQQLRSHF